MHELSDTQVRILFSLHSYNFITADKAYDAFTRIMLNVETLGDNVVLDEGLIVEDEFKPFVEWLCVLFAYFLAGDETQLLAQLCCNTQSIALKKVGVLGNSKVNMLAAAAFIKTVCPVMHAIFVAEHSVHSLITSD